MIYIEKGFQPEALIQAKRNGLQCYDDMDTATKDAIKKNLYAEQYHLCAYCMRKLNLSTMQIEHYIAQSPEDGSYDAALTIDYHNMLGVCPGGKGRVHNLRHLTCDQHRGNTPLTVDPLNAVSIAKIKYSANGSIGSDDPVIQRDLHETLNLNCSEARLKENRKAALDALKGWVQRQYEGKSIPKATWQRIYAKYCGTQNAEKSEYIGIIEWYLQKKINASN